MTNANLINWLDHAWDRLVDDTVREWARQKPTRRDLLRRITRLDDGALTYRCHYDDFALPVTAPVRNRRHVRLSPALGTRILRFFDNLEADTRLGQNPNWVLMYEGPRLLRMQWVPIENSRHVLPDAMYADYTLLERFELVAEVCHE